MIDALLYAVRDGIRAAGFGYGYAECDITDEGKPPPRCGNWFVAVHDGTARSTNDNCLYELYDFSVTLTARVVTCSVDRIGDQLIARNLRRNPEANKQGFNAKVEQLRGFLHMNWAVTVLQNQSPASANDNLAAWATGVVYGFCEPARYRSSGKVAETPGGWFSEEPDSEMLGVKAELRFEGAKRFQPQTAAAGAFA